MDSAELAEYDGESILERILDSTPAPSSERHCDFLVYVMGPYTPFDLAYIVPNADLDLDARYVDSELFDPENHEDMVETLQQVCSALREDPGVRAFIATDVDIPTARNAGKAGRETRGRSPLDQSIEYALISDTVVFILDEAGLNAGVASEIGAILGEFDLRLRNPEPPKKPRRRVRIYCSEAFSSASIEEIPHGFGVDVYRYENEPDLLGNLRQFVTAVEYASEYEDLPLFGPPNA